MGEPIPRELIAVGVAIGAIGLMLLVELLERLGVKFPGAIEEEREEGGGDGR